MTRWRVRIINGPGVPVPCEGEVPDWRDGDARSEFSACEAAEAVVRREAMRGEDEGSCWECLCWPTKGGMEPVGEPQKVTMVIDKWVPEMRWRIGWYSDGSVK